LLFFGVGRADLSEFHATKNGAITARHCTDSKHE
jgi:hypothetical protein